GRGSSACPSRRAATRGSPCSSTGRGLIRNTWAIRLSTACSASSQRRGRAAGVKGATSMLQPRLALALSAPPPGGCADLSSTEQRSLTGGLGGAAGGAVLGAIGGNAALGAIAGAAAGTIGGYLYDQHKKSEQAAYEQGVKDGQAKSTSSG